MKIFIDLGAYIGDTLEIALKEYKEFDKFYAFEPLNRNFTILAAKFAADNKIVLLKIAADISDGMSNIYVTKQGYDGGSLCLGQGDHVENKAELVETVNISNYLKKNFDIADEIILKVDIEGKEYDIFQLMINDGSIKYIKKIFCEWHWKQSGISESRHNKIVEELNKYGYPLLGFNMWDEYLAVPRKGIRKVIFPAERKAMLVLKRYCPRLFYFLVCSLKNIRVIGSNIFCKIDC